MRIVILALGTWGDVRPNVVLAQALQKAGYEVLLVATEPFRQWVQERGVDFAGVSLDLQAMMDAIMGGDGEFFATIQRLAEARKQIRPAIVQVGKDIAAAMRQGDVLLLNGLTLSWVNGLVEKFQSRAIYLNMQSQFPTSQFPAMSTPSLPAWMPLRSAYHRISYDFSRWTSWTTQGSLGNQLRTEHLALPKQTWGRHKAMLNSIPALIPVSRHVLASPADWPPHQHVTGYIFEDEPDWQPPQDLLDFLSNGEKPIYIGFGSMAVRKPTATIQTILEAVRRSGRRAVLLSGWAGIGTSDLPKNVFLVKYAPHSWLFPRMSAVVHHGGAGTTAAGLKAGVPAVVVPFFLDQPFWGQRVYELGVGTKPISRDKLTAENLAAAIQEATTNRAMQEKAAALSQKIAAEDGVGEAVKIIQEILA